MANRNLVLPLIERYLPLDGVLVKRATVGMDHIVKDWGNVGTTCGYLPHWLWWRMGCLDTALMCRHEPDTAFTYKNGAQINRVYAHPKFTHVSTPSSKKATNDKRFTDGEIYPKTGDAVIIQGLPDSKGNDTSHIFITLNAGDWETDIKGRWLVAEAGQEENGGHTATRGVEFKLGRWAVGAKWMLGWLDIDQITFGPSVDSHEYLTPFLKDAVSARATNLIGIWKVTDSRGAVWFYFFYKGFRVFYSEANSPTLLQGGGHWHPRGLGYNIHWDWGNEESITLTSTMAATGADGNGPWTGKKVSSSPTTMANFHSNIGLSF